MVVKDYGSVKKDPEVIYNRRGLHVLSQQSDTDVKITKFRVNCETPKTRGLVLSGLINRVC